MNIRQIIERDVGGAEFVDIAGLWGTKGEKISSALKGGARSATLVDIIPQGATLWKDLEAYLLQKGIEPHQYRTQTANVDSPDFRRLIGRFDFVSNTGLLYHCPNPVLTLRQLRSVCKHRLTFQTNVVPQRIETDAGELKLPQNGVLFVPGLSGSERAIVHSYFKTRGGRLYGKSDEEPVWFHKTYNYGPWWWLFTASFVESALVALGFRMLEQAVVHDKHLHAYCEVRSRREEPTKL